MLCLDSKFGGGKLSHGISGNLPALCLDSKFGGGKLAGGNWLFSGQLPQLDLLG